MNMRSAAAALALGTVLIPAPAEAMDLLSSSPAAKQYKLRVVAGEPRSNDIRVPQSAGVTLPAFRLGDDGSVTELKAGSSWAASPGLDRGLPWGCGGGVKASYFENVTGNNAGGFLVVTGEGAALLQRTPRLIQWSPSTPHADGGVRASLPAPPAPNARLREHRVFRTRGTSDLVYFASWDVPRPKGGTVVVEEAGLLEIADALGQPTVSPLVSATFDSDGQRVKGSISAREFLGVLSIQGEGWLVFSSRGTEGGGYSMIPMPFGRVCASARQANALESNCVPKEEAEARARRAHEVILWGC